MANEDEGSKVGQKQPEGERKFSQQQYDLLKRCSDNKDMTEWNNWRKENPYKEVFLMRAKLAGAYLEGAKLQNAFLWEAELQEANLRKTCLQNAKLMRANLQGAEFGRAKLQDADFSRAIVDGRTLIWGCKVNRKTKFEGVALGSIRIYPDVKQLLEYNIRRMNWDGWYKKHWFWRFPVRLFWAMNDYGLSTGWIVGWFFGLAISFAVVYWLWPSCVMFEGLVGDIRGFWHALYFSVVTMTTLGFGDIAANPDSWCGQTLLMLQVILGYVLLGALVTRFAVLFTAGGPAGKFSPIKTKETGDDKKNKA